MVMMMQINNRSFYNFDGKKVKFSSKFLKYIPSENSESFIQKCINMFPNRIILTKNHAIKCAVINIANDPET